MPNSFWFKALSLRQPKMSCPDGCDEAGFLRFLRSVDLHGGPRVELDSYLVKEWRRFAYTYGMCAGLQGQCLEIGSSPYFMTALLTEFSSLEVTKSNYETHEAVRGVHHVAWISPKDTAPQVRDIEYDIFNIEGGRLPYPDGTFDSVLFCEVIEHLTHDPSGALAEIRRVLKPDGKLILTTPNAACLRNVSRILRGKSVADRYSNYGPYGRHNREYTFQELIHLIEATGFAVERSFTANVTFPHMSDLVATFLGELIFSLLAFPRSRSLGQYSFITANKVDVDEIRRPNWLYRSYAEADMVLPHS